jgi:hypothetical protein
MTTQGRSLELYYIDGRPDGMLTAEMFNWTGHVLMVPRTQITAALARAEASYAGVYLLLGERDGEPFAYIGESEDIGQRIKGHDVKKDWWTTAIFVASAGNKLNKAHARYLEARLIEEAGKIGRVVLDNGTNPARPPLSEADTAKMEAFLENILIVLPALRVDMFIQRTRPAPAAPAKQSASNGASARFVLEVKTHGVKASAVVQDGEFIVLAGSLARLNWEGVVTGYTKLHEELKRSGVLEIDGVHCIFKQNYAFTSPSAAAAVVTGRQTNGAIEWRNEATGRTYKAWEAEQLAAARS